MKASMTITRFALFEGTITSGEAAEFRTAILREVLPKWQAFPCALAVRICFSNERDTGAPEIPLILAITYPSREAVDIALASPERAAAKAAIPELIGHGAKEMEFGAGLEYLMDAARCEGLVGKAHDSFRAALRGCDVAEPTDDDIVVILGGGGGGR